MNTFDILMIIALGALAGTGAGLLVGRAARRQMPEWSLMSSQDKILNIALIVFFSAACMATLAWYELM